MTSKLIKYEFRSASRSIGVIWAALIAAAILLGIVMRFMGNIFPEDATGAMAVLEFLFELIPPIIYGALFVAMLVITVLIIVMRFYRGLLGDEGYLMHTLPVKPWQLITAKGAVASIVVIISGIAAALSIFILVGIQNMGDISTMFKAFFGACGEHPKLVLVVIEGIIILVLGVMKSVYQIYTAMAIGQLAGKHRILLSLGAYIGISVILTIITGILGTIAEASGLGLWISGLIMDMNIYADGFYAVQIMIAFIFLLTAVQLVVFHIVTERILSKKLNLI